MGLSFISVSLTGLLEGVTDEVAELYVSPYAVWLEGAYSQHLSSPYQNNGFQLDIVGECLRLPKVRRPLHQPELTSNRFLSYPWRRVP
jgi:hypothetical protein